MNAREFAAVVAAKGGIFKAWARLRLPLSEREDCYQAGLARAWEAAQRHEPAKGTATGWLVFSGICGMREYVRDKYYGRRPGSPERLVRLAVPYRERDHSRTDRDAGLRIDLDRALRAAGRGGTLLRARYLAGYRQAEIGRVLGVSESRVSQLEKAAKLRLRRILAGYP